MPTRTIAIANQKGGVGKTTTAVSLSACLAEAGHKTLLVDFDPQANATSGFGLEKLPGGSVYDVLLGDNQLASLIRPSGLNKLDIIPSEVDLAAAELDVARHEHYLQRFQKVLAPLKAEGHYNFIIVDCPPSLGILTLNALAAADSVIVPIQCEYYALEGLSVIVRVIDKLRNCGAAPDLRLEGIVMTMFDGRTNLAQQVVEDVRRHFGALVYQTVIPRTVRLSEAPGFGKPITVYDPHSAAASAYRKLATEIVSAGAVPTEQAEPSSQQSPMPEPIQQAEPVVAAPSSGTDEPAPAEEPPPS